MKVHTRDEEMTSLLNSFPELPKRLTEGDRTSHTAKLTVPAPVRGHPTAVNGRIDDCQVHRHQDAGKNDA